MSKPVRANFNGRVPFYVQDRIITRYLSGQGAIQYLYLRSYRNFEKTSPDFGWAYPSLARMAEWFGISKQAVSQRIKRLVAAGWVEKRKRGQGIAYRVKLPEVYLLQEFGQRYCVDPSESQAGGVNTMALTDGQLPGVDYGSTSRCLPRDKINKKLSVQAALENPEPVPTALPGPPPVEPDPWQGEPNLPDLFAYRQPDEPVPVHIPDFAASVPNDPVPAEEFPPVEFSDPPVPVLKPQARRGTAGRTACAGTLKNLSRGLRKRLPGSRGAVLAAYQGEQDGHPLFDARGLDYTRSRVLQQLCPTAIITRPGRETE